MDDTNQLLKITFDNMILLYCEIVVNFSLFSIFTNYLGYYFCITLVYSLKYFQHTSA